MTSHCRLHPACDSRTRTGRVLLIGVALLLMAWGAWLLMPAPGGKEPAGGAGVASLQTLIFIHRGDLQVPAERQP